MCTVSKSLLPLLIHFHGRVALNSPERTLLRASSPHTYLSLNFALGPDAAEEKPQECEERRRMSGEQSKLSILI